MGVRRERQGSSEERDVETEAGPRVGFCLEMTKFWEEGRWLQLVATNRELETVRSLSCAFKDLRTRAGLAGSPVRQRLRGAASADCAPGPPTSGWTGGEPGFGDLQNES